MLLKSDKCAITSENEISFKEPSVQEACIGIGFLKTRESSERNEKVYTTRYSINKVMPDDLLCISRSTARGKMYGPSGKEKKMQECALIFVPLPTALIDDSALFLIHASGEGWNAQKNRASRNTRQRRWLTYTRTLKWNSFERIFEGLVNFLK